MLTEKDAVQEEKNALFFELRHRCSLCTCPSYISVEDLKRFLAVLKGEQQDVS